MMSFPDIPEVPASQRASDRVHLAYHDICQDGRVNVTALPPTLGAVVWRNLLAEHPLTQTPLSPQIAIPLLSKLTIEATEETITLSRPIVGKGGFQLAHTCDDAGMVNRLIMTMWTEVYGTLGRLYLPPDDGAPQVCIGRVFAEHVFTRPFAAPSDRKVTRFDVEGFAPVPDALHHWRSPAELLELPPGATALDTEPAVDPSPIGFGLHHTDTNQHVNSLVYPRLFEDVALRRLAAHGRGTRFLARFAQVAYRKPSFAGDTVLASARAFALGDRLGVAGSFRAESEDQPRCTVRLVLSQ